MTYLGIFGTEFSKTIVIFEISTLNLNFFQNQLIGLSENVHVERL